MNIESAKRGRGRPPKNPVIAAPVNEVVEPKRGRGRPKKAEVLPATTEAPVVKAGRGRPRKAVVGAVTVPAPVVKAGRGRPKKVAEPVEAQPVVAVKAGRGRPRKTAVEAVAAVAPAAKAGRGRPRKNPVAVAVTVPVDGEVKRGRGRPKKTADSVIAAAPVVKAGRGRPRKNPVAVAFTPPVDGEVKRGPGRPRKNAEPVALATPVVKAGRGRPRKNPVVAVAAPADGAVKRGRGRPRKNTEPVAVAAPVVKTGRGRPRKNPVVAVAAPVDGEVKRGPGRPRKNAEPVAVAAPVVKAGRGRPRKNPVVAVAAPVDSEVKRGRGRPKKNAEPVVAAAPIVKAGRGRPRKNPVVAVAAPVDGEVKRGPGRPRKNAEPVAVAAPVVKAGRGRPRKNPVVAVAAPVDSKVKRGRGRPRKNAEPVVPAVPAVKAGRGRPRKNPVVAVTAPVDGDVKRGPGRPKKNPKPVLAAPVVGEKRGRGRPRKNAIALDPSLVSRDVKILPILPIRDQVYFPHMIFPLLVGRELSVRALDEAIRTERQIVLVAQKHSNTEEPEPEELYTVGIVAEIMQHLRIPDGTVRVMLEGVGRVKIHQYTSKAPYYQAAVEPVPDNEVSGLEIEALMRGATNQFEQIVNIGRNIAPEVLINVVNIEEPGKLADTITPYLHQLRVETKQEILEKFDVKERLDKLCVILKKEWEIIEIQKNIRSRVEKEMGDTQREFFLREQLKAIQQELGERDERGTEIDDYREKIIKAEMPESVAERASKEVDRLEKMPFAAPEGTVIRTYLDWLTSLPWSIKTDDNLSIADAEAALNEDHFGLKKVKERILEFLAVRKLVGSDMKGPILCFVGPPGVGKTSLGKSIARSLGRKFIRISLGGVRDEAEIRGHRRTYIGAMPGRIIQGIKQTGSNNPVFMLDEIDKLGMDFRGDPSSALLEALDPEQNGEFSDHYLEAPFNLRDVMFITTANMLEPIPAALRDRMEVITFTGYTEDEKQAIASNFLVPKQLKEHGLDEKTIEVKPEAVRKIIQEYTRESGVRNLEREIAAVCRKVAFKVAGGAGAKVTIGDNEIGEYLGRPRFRHGLMEEKDEVAAATGLVYTEFGGDIVTIEVSVMKGQPDKLTLTGQLGNVMKESARAALSVVRARAKTLGVNDDFFGKQEIHIHVPAGAVPKDGPSAGITMATALASAATGRPVTKEIAMTGEITLRGKVLPIGGVKEKVLGAHRSGIRRVILPEENRKDLEDVPDTIQSEMTFDFVSNIDQVFALALLPKRKK